MHSVEGFVLSLRLAPKPFMEEGCRPQTSDRADSGYFFSCHHFMLSGPVKLSPCQKPSYLCQRKRKEILFIFLNNFS